MIKQISCTLLSFPDYDVKIIFDVISPFHLCLLTKTRKNVLLKIIFIIKPFFHHIIYVQVHKYVLMKRFFGYKDSFKQCKLKLFHYLQDVIGYKTLSHTFLFTCKFIAVIIILYWYNIHNVSNLQLLITDDYVS